MNLIRHPSRWLDEKTAGLAKSRFLSHIAIQYYCAACGVIFSIMFFLAFVAADFITPIKPWWDAEQTANHYQKHTVRVRAGAAILVVSGMFYLPFSAVISYQMRRIPNVHYLVHQLQLASAAAGVWTFILPGIILAATSYRPYRPIEITQMFNDFFWICAFMPWPTFIAQNFAFSYAIICDSRKKPLFPKELAILNIITPILLTPAIGIHCTKTGSVAYNGAMTFWVPGVAFCLQLILDSWYLYASIREEARELSTSDNNFQHDLEVCMLREDGGKVL
jgi:hypothetical protein